MNSIPRLAEIWSSPCPLQSLIALRSGWTRSAAVASRFTFKTCTRPASLGHLLHSALSRSLDSHSGDSSFAARCRFPTVQRGNSLFLLLQLHELGEQHGLTLAAAGLDVFGGEPLALEFQAGGFVFM